jgi:hypothetical protein
VFSQDIGNTKFLRARKVLDGNRSTGLKRATCWGLIISGKAHLPNDARVPTNARFNKQIAPFRAVSHYFDALDVGNPRDLRNNMLHQLPRGNPFWTDAAQAVDRPPLFAQASAYFVFGLGHTGIN